MLDKTDPELGKKVHEHLVNLGVETPFNETSYTDEEKVAGLTHHYRLTQRQFLGLDLTDDSLMETPKRIAKLQVYESFKGLDYKNFPKLTVVQNKFYKGFVAINNIRFISLCEHHHERIIGKAWVAYIPDAKVTGLSKIPRIVDFFAARPAVQERTTTQIFETLKFLLNTENVAVTIKAAHLCMMARGIREPCADTTTALKGGDFLLNERTRTEFENQIQHLSSPLL